MIIRLLLSTAAVALALSLHCQEAPTLTQQYRATETKLIDAALIDHGGIDKLSYLCDRIGNRLSGSPGLEKAIVWAAAQMKTDGLVNVVTPRVKTTHWVRGNESASITDPATRSMTILGPAARAA